MQTIEIQTSHPYPVFVGSNLISNIAQMLEPVCKYQKVAIVTDDIVEKLYLDQVIRSFPNSDHVFSIVFPNGEQTKNSENLLKLYAFYTEKQITRSDLIIALGGGVIGDLTGYSAATYLRGVKYIHIPTTLLAQVDSSVGGKTAINIPQGKNLVGSFYQPVAVFCDIDTLSSLSEVNFSSGVAEVIKYGCIYDKALFDQISKIRNPETLVKIITRCIKIKAEVVNQDEFDTGLRMILNFGHTIGHAVEKQYHFSTYTHGQAVAIGMVKMTQLSEKAGLTEPGTAQQIAALCQQFGLPTDCEISQEELFASCCLDKKNMNTTIHIILLKQIGECFIHQIPHDQFQEFLNQ